jgi:hypothetical protein
MSLVAKKEKLIMAAKKVKIDWQRVNKLLQAQCSGSSIASILGIHENTLYDRCKKDQSMEFMAYSAKKKSEGKELLKEKMYDIAMAGDKILLIWLSKQYLGMSESLEKLSDEACELVIQKLKQRYETETQRDN